MKIKLIAFAIALLLPVINYASEEVSYPVVHCGEYLTCTKGVCEMHGGNPDYFAISTSEVDTKDGIYNFKNAMALEELSSSALKGYVSCFYANAVGFQVPARTGAYHYLVFDNSQAWKETHRHSINNPAGCLQSADQCGFIALDQK